MRLEEFDELGGCPRWILVVNGKKHRLDGRLRRRGKLDAAIAARLTPTQRRPINLSIDLHRFSLPLKLDRAVQKPRDVHHGQGTGELNSRQRRRSRADS